MTNHRLLDTFVTPVEVPPETTAHAQSTAREDALPLTISRALNLASACAEVERWTGRLLWRGSPAPRTCTSTLEVYDVLQDVSLSPRYPLVAHLDSLVVHTVRRWDDEGEAYQDAEYLTRPMGQIRLKSGPGTYEFVVELTPTTEVPDIAVEAAARLWSYRELKRPTANPDSLIAESQNLASAMYRSGASSLLRSLKSNHQL